MQEWCDQVQPHCYPRDLVQIAQEFGPQLEEDSCGAAAVRHGLLLGGLTVPEGTLQAILGTKDKGICGEDLHARLEALALAPEFLELKRSRESPRQFWERLGREMDERGAFVLACVYGGEHWVTLGRWHRGKIRIIDSAGWDWDLLVYSLTPEAFDEQMDWQDCVRLVRPGKRWQKNYKEWLPARNRLIRLESHAPGASGTMAERLKAAAHVYLNDDWYTYDRLKFHLSGQASMAVEVEEPATQAVSVSTVGEGPNGQTVVVRSLAESEPRRPGPPEIIFRFPGLCGWQLS